jgi:hypothetical protein
MMHTMGLRCIMTLADHMLRMRLSDFGEGIASSFTYPDDKTGTKQIVE